MRKTVLIGLAALSLAPAALAAPKPSIAIRQPVIRPTGPGQPTTAAYMTVENLTARPVKLSGVTCACAGSVAPHESHSMGGMMHMQPANEVVVPPHGKLAFAPGGLHLMVMDLKKPVKAGEGVAMELTFDHTPPMTVKFEARR